jgi:hypothetical protein
MKHHTSFRALAISFAILVVVAVSSTARANANANPPSSRTIDVEIIKLSKANKSRASFSLTVEDRSESEATAPIGDGRYTVSTYQRTEGTNVLVRIAISGNNDRNEPVLSIKASAVAAIGKRIVIARIEQPDGTSHEVALKVR